MPHDAAGSVTNEQSSQRVNFPPIKPIWLIAAMALFFAADHLLLLRFLGVASPAAYLSEVTLLLGLCLVLLRAGWSTETIPTSRWLICIGVAFAILLLAGEGRLFYSNLDWQVRDAVLHDMIIWRWPFAYSGFKTPQLLRAPIGMYLLPAIVGKVCGQSGADLALLAQNSWLLGTVFTLGSMLFPNPRARRAAVIVILLFSGMDSLGLLLGRPAQFFPLSRSIDGWAGIQYSSHLTMAFWVPQHALVGWIGALLYMLWRSARLPLSIFFSILPLMALWSPLGLMGTMPFAAFAGLETVIRRRLTLSELMLPLIAVASSAISLVYLQLDGDRVGVQFYPIDPIIYAIVEFTEVIPFLFASVFFFRGGRLGNGTIVIVAACLLFFPFIKIGHNVDFMMRASIPALAILSVLMTDLVTSGRDNIGRSIIIVCLAIGALTPAREVWRALIFKPSPPPLCDVAQAWDQSYANYGKDTYFAALSSLPTWLRPGDTTLASPTALRRCWERPWAVSRLGF